MARLYEEKLRQTNSAGIEAAKNFIFANEQFEGIVPADEVDMEKINFYIDSLEQLVLSSISRSVLDSRELFTKLRWVAHARYFVKRAAREIDKPVCYSDVRPLHPKNSEQQEEMYDEAIQRYSPEEWLKNLSAKE